MAQDPRTGNERIWDRLAPEIREQFTLKGVDYQDGYQHLGLPGQFSDINRKFWKLKRSMWEGQPLFGEDTREILMDLIGHCLLSIDMIDQERAEHAESVVGIPLSLGGVPRWEPSH